MKNKVLQWVAVSAILLAATLCLTVCAAEDGGICGDNLTWVLNDQGILTISGSGPMADFAVYDTEGTCESP